MEHLQTIRSNGINVKDLLTRVIKYVVEGGAVAIAAWLIPRKKLDVQAIIMIALTAAAVFAILDLFAPAVGVSARMGAGFGLGATLTGFGGVPVGGQVMPGIPVTMA